MQGGNPFPDRRPGNYRSASVMTAMTTSILTKTNNPFTTFCHHARHGTFPMANATAIKASSIPPRFIRFMDAPGYLGMCRDEFNETVRPNVREFPIGNRVWRSIGVESGKSTKCSEVSDFERALARLLPSRVVHSMHGAALVRKHPFLASGGRCHSGRPQGLAGAQERQHHQSLLGR